MEKNRGRLKANPTGDYSGGFRRCCKGLKCITTTAMPSTGDRLRAERELRELTVQQAAEATNIKSDHIRAIEADDWGAFAAPIYVRGFVKTYARHLRLNDKEIVAQLDDELAGRTDFRETRRSGGLRRGPLDFVMMKLALVRWQILFPLGLGLAVFGAAWWGWKSWQNRTLATQPVVAPRLYQPRTDSRSGTLPLPPATNASGAVPRRR